VCPSLEIGEYNKIISMSVSLSLNEFLFLSYSFLFFLPTEVWFGFFGFKQHPKILFCRAALQPLLPMPVVLHGIVVTKVQDPTFGLVEPHTVDLIPSIQSVQVPLQPTPALARQVITRSQKSPLTRWKREGSKNRCQMVTRNKRGNKQENTSDHL